MPGTNSTAPNKSVLYEQLEQKKVEIENQIAELNKVLVEEGNVGLNGELVDIEGYPRADIDIYKVRLARQQINCLRNDYKDVLEQLEEELGKIYSEVKSLAPTASATPHTANHDHLKPARPFCLVTQVDSDSPSSEAGIRVNDAIVQFGPYTHGSVAKNLAEIGELVKSSENKIILLNVSRSEENETTSTKLVKLKLIPKKWNGHGLLGCKIIPIE
jgi:26S proteasome non-ATPase regulatory subunit 9